MTTLRLERSSFASEEMTKMKKKNGHESPYRSSELFRLLANRTAHGVGHPWSFALALAVVVTWAVTGPLFRFSDTWQLVINTGTTIVTFLMVFLIQNTQNRDSHAIHLKLDELIRVQAHARNRFIAVEGLTDEELEELQEEFDRLAREKKEKRRDSEPHSSPSTTRHRAARGRPVA